MGSSQSTSEFSYTGTIHDYHPDNDKRSVFDWPGDNNDCTSRTGIRFDILWGVTVLLLVLVVLRQWHRDRRTYKGIEQEHRPATDDLESQKNIANNAR
ncbi:uncharacterized protein BT62DRAFT_1081294 [Guyanagaster necrorhizus]|uniref:Uncharacterized protein n=1 Tax=Guyanagaster necrorhizus TaxID=856835 RepID=A0A9P8ALP1_9AGAR|nr:uncharacterized protein BT62DRAFT_1081294 [Guyanagaster necrorhizus MCA 3950]KAG7439909.1 hypothetical protein BT62DRAFT_1081294 [Guyanagaster necrorhizus MCA 3950]